MHLLHGRGLDSGRKERKESSGPRDTASWRTPVWNKRQVARPRENRSTTSNPASAGQCTERVRYFPRTEKDPEDWRTTSCPFHSRRTFVFRHVKSDQPSDTSPPE